MASLYRDVVVEVPMAEVWRALCDIGHAAELFPGILTASELLGPQERVVTFSNGLVVTERILGIDEEHHRVAYSAKADNFEHHSASMQLAEAGTGATRFIWITDFLPDEAASFVEPLVDEGICCFQRRWSNQSA